MECETDIEIAVARLASTPSFHQHDDLRRLLPPAEVQRISQFRYPQDVALRYLGYRVLAERLEQHGFPRTVLSSLKRTSFGRPTLDIDLDFNLSHSDDVVAVAVASRGKVGVDIERAHPVNPQDYALHLSASEMEDLTRGEGRDPHAFLRLWASKEAAVKADGRGFSIPPAEVRVAENVARGPGFSFHLHRFDLADEIICYAASEHHCRTPQIMAPAQQNFQSQQKRS
jgi:4'-phosphopantetheinyl transferase